MVGLFFKREKSYTLPTEMTELISEGRKDYPQPRSVGFDIGILREILSASPTKNPSVHRTIGGTLKPSSGIRSPRLKIIKYNFKFIYIYIFFLNYILLFL